MAQEGDCFVLQVKGVSMEEDGILDGDFVVVRKQATARKRGDRGGPGEQLRHGEALLQAKGPCGASTLPWGDAVHSGPGMTSFVLKAKWWGS